MSSLLNKITILSAIIISAISCRTMQSGSELNKKIKVEETQRAQLLKNMQIWKQVPTSELDLFLGPTRHYKWGQDIYCTFKEPEEGDFGAGKNTKFLCIDNKTKEVLKLKYDIRNAEVYGEVAFSRLMYALGFNHDHYYPVRVECDNCPKDPWAFIQGHSNNPNLEEDSERANRIFIPALLEVKMDGHKIENFEDQGISWKEFNDFTGLTKEQKTIRDAFVLLMGFTHHADSKPDQQRLSCVKSSATKIKGKKYDCQQAQFLVHDGGWSFGAGVEPSINSMRAKMNVKFWTRYPVFKNSKCKLNVRKIMNSEFQNKEISEDGRKFLADLLNKLSRDQIKDLFRASRVDLRDQVLYKMSSEESLNQWANAFEKRRKEITEARCPKRL